jgi:ferredoxin
VVQRKIIKIDETLCTGCSNCIISCAEGAINPINGKAMDISDNLYDGFGACIGTCLVGALSIEELETKDFDSELARLIKYKQDQQSAPLTYKYIIRQFCPHVVH